LPRHQTLKATLDWSYALLDEDEKVILRRLGIFVNGFTMSGAIAVMGEDWLVEGRVIDALSGLAAKSLIVFDHEGRADCPANRNRPPGVDVARSVGAIRYRELIVGKE